MLGAGSDLFQGVSLLFEGFSLVPSQIQIGLLQELPKETATGLSLLSVQPWCSSAGWMQDSARLGQAFKSLMPDKSCINFMVKKMLS